MRKSVRFVIPSHSEALISVSDENLIFSLKELSIFTVLLVHFRFGFPHLVGHVAGFFGAFPDSRLPDMRDSD